jgi:hypothetical protein
MSKPSFKETGIAIGHWAKAQSYEKNCLCCDKAFLTKQPTRALFCSRKCQGKHRQREVAVLLKKIKMERGCAKCGFKGHPAALDFDHTRGTKRRQVGQSPTLKFLVEEMEKCTILCANCHRVKTYENGEYRHKTVRLEVVT